MRTYLAVWMVLITAYAAATRAQESAGQKAADNASARNETEPSMDEEHTQKLLQQLKSIRFEDRLAALHQLVGHDRALPVLKDSKIRAALIELLKRETNTGRNYNLQERTDFQYYYGFLMEAVQKIAEDYSTPEAWKDLVYSNYAPGSPLGQWIAKQPESYDPLLTWVSDNDSGHRYQALWMMGEICANNPGLCPKILPLLRDRIGSPDTWTRQGAMQGLGICGTAEDILRLRDLPACSNDWGTRPLCRQIEEKIGKRLAEPKKQ